MGGSRKAKGIKVWDKEARILSLELPPCFSLQARKAWSYTDHGRMRDRLWALVSAFEDLASLTFAAGLAAIVAAQDEGFRGDGAKDLLRDVVADKRATKDKKSFGDWGYLVNELLPKLIKKRCADRRPDGFLQHLPSPSAKTAEWRVVHIRNKEIGHGVPVNPMELEKIQAYENHIRQDVMANLGFWWEYSLGWVDGDEIRFAKPRLGTLPLSAVSRLPSDFPLCDSETLRPAVLVGERDRTLWCLSPFVVYDRLAANEKWLPQQNYESTFRYLEFRSDPKARVVWRSRLFNADSQETVSIASEYARTWQKSLAKYASTATTENGLGFDQLADVFRLPEREIACLSFDIGDEAGPLVPLGTDGAACVPDERNARMIVDATGTCSVIKVHAPEGSSHASRSLVVKVLRASYDESAEILFEREREFLRTHSDELENVVRYVGAGRVALGSDGGKLSDEARERWIGRPFFAMEYLPRNLRQTIEARDAVVLEPAASVSAPDRPLAELRVLKHVARALYMGERCAYALNVIYEKTRSPAPPGWTGAGAPESVHFLHRDVRPENLLDAGFGEIRLCDFNSAFFPSSSESGKEEDHPLAIVVPTDRGREQSASYTRNAHLSRQYCAPEVWSCPPLYSETADVFSLGMVLNELLFGEPTDTQARAAKKEYLEGADNFYAAPPPRSIAAQTMGAVGEFARTPSADWVASLSPWFDLRQLVRGATAPADRRWSMQQFLDRISVAGRTLRAYTVWCCEQRTRAALAEPTPRNLSDALIFLAAAFGRSPRSDLLRLVRCELCFRGDGQGTYRRNPKACGNQTIERLASGMRKVEGYAAVRSASGSRQERAMSGEDESYLEALTVGEAVEILELSLSALHECPGLVDLAVDGRRGAAGTRPHEQFRSSAEFWMVRTGLDALTIVSSSPSVRPPTDGLEEAEEARAGSLPEAVMRFMVTLGAADSSD